MAPLRVTGYIHHFVTSQLIIYLFMTSQLIIRHLMTSQLIIRHFVTSQLRSMSFEVLFCKNTYAEIVTSTVIKKCLKCAIE